LEIPALLIAFVLAPFAWFVVWVVGWLLVFGAAYVFGFDLDDNDPADPGQFLVAFGSMGCAGYWLLMLPVALVLRALHKLSFWTVVVPALAVIASIAFLAVGNGGGHPFFGSPR
jgi:hypothetical protein